MLPPRSTTPLSDSSTRTHSYFLLETVLFCFFLFNVSSCVRCGRTP